MSNSTRKLSKAVDEVRKTFEKTLSKSIGESSASLTKKTVSVGQKIKASLANLFGSNDPMVYVCVLLILIYVAIARPSNTPKIFRNALVKILIVGLVVYVASQNLLLGLVFGLSMVLTIAYAHQNESRDRFDGENDQQQAAVVAQAQQQQQQVDPNIVVANESFANQDAIVNLKQHFDNNSSMSKEDAAKLLAAAQKQMSNVLGQMSQFTGENGMQSFTNESFNESFDGENMQPPFNMESFSESFTNNTEQDSKAQFEQVTPGVPSSSLSSVQAFAGTTGLQIAPFENI